MAIAGTLFIWFCGFLPTIAAGETLRLTTAWVPRLGVELSFYLDGLSLTFALLITGIGALVMLYAARYLAGHVHQGRFSLYLTAFMLAMLGLVTADNLLLLFVFWELTTITSYLLIGFSHASQKARRSALQALLLTGIGGLALLAGIILLGTAAGSFEMSQINARPGGMIGHAHYLPILILLLAGAFTKSAQFPLHFWLPNAMAAPTPVSAYLHSATMVKAGIYLLARVHPSMAGSDVWLWTLTLFGAITMVFASVMALRQTDLKLALAYTTLMALGALTLLLGNESGYTITAAVTFLIVHSLYKAALFLVVGILDAQTGTRDAGKLFGLARAMPFTAFAAGLAALSMAGFPPFLGFIGKELKYAGAIAVASEPVLVAGAFLIASALMVALAGIVSFRPFWSRSGAPIAGVKEAPWPMLIGPLVLALMGAGFGVFPDMLAVALVNPTVGAIIGDAGEAKELQLWAGVNLPLMLSIATFVLGFVIYRYKLALRATLITLTDRAPSFDDGWDRLMVGVAAGSKALTQRVQTGVLRHYMLVTFGTALLVMGATLALRTTGIPQVGWPEVAIWDWLVFLLVLMGTFLTTITYSRITAIAGLGVVGIGMAMIFILYSAPDVAITQLLVETLVVVLFAAAALKLPSLRETTQGFRVFDAIIGTAFGIVTAVILMKVTAGPIDRELTAFFEAESWPAAYGQNIVNVILVDFRALDTFGEIAVILIAAISIFALLRARPQRERP